MPHSENLRFIKRDNKEQAVHLNSKGAAKFDMARSETLAKKKKMAEKMKKAGGYESYRGSKSHDVSQF